MEEINNIPYRSLPDKFYIYTSFCIIPGTYTDVTVMVAANNKYYIAKVKNGKEFNFYKFCGMIKR